MRLLGEGLFVGCEMREFLIKCWNLSGLTQIELARSAGVHQSWLSRLFRGERGSPNSSMVDAVIKTLAEVLEKKGEYESQQASYLCSMFRVEENPTARRNRAAREVALLGLMAVWPGFNQNQAESFCDRPLLADRLDYARGFFRAASLLADQPRLREAAIATILGSGLGLTREQVEAVVGEPSFPNMVVEAAAGLEALAESVKSLTEGSS